MKQFVRGAAAAALCASLSFGDSAQENGPYALLRKIPSPPEMLKEHFPAAYTVPVTLTGTIADEMKRSLEKMELPGPAFNEILDRDGNISLIIANKEYSLQTRDLVSGIINPTEMINSIVESLLRFRDTRKFSLLKKETTISVRDTVFKKQEMLYISLCPRGKRFGYSFDDRGTYVVEEWLTGLDLLVGRNDFRVYEITTRRHSRKQTLQQVDKPEPQVLAMKYHIEYANDTHGRLPARLRLFINNRLTLSVSAEYRRAGRHIVFSSRSICHHDRHSEKSCLEMNYGIYRFSRFLPRPNKRREHKYAGRLSKAAALSRDAAAKLEKGDISHALRIYARLIDDFPETPHAIEARKLIESLE
ncbi:MAG: hypothetical protein GF350_11115 [Chitinivibrionales bacterium]|nr:hypothetical protein [Chitinivibrionales bacterium]